MMIYVYSFIKNLTFVLFCSPSPEPDVEVNDKKPHWRNADIFHSLDLRVDQTMI